MDEEELRQVQAASYVPWSTKEANAVLGSASGSSSDAAARYTLRQRKSVKA